MKKWQCIVCGFVYDEEEGLESEGIAPGTKWEDIPEDWCCPECGVTKEDFEIDPEVSLSSGQWNLWNPVPKSWTVGVNLTF